MDKHLMYKVGTGWVFDLSTNLGYKVEREKIKGKSIGKVINYEIGYSAKYDRTTEVNKDSIEFELNIPVSAIVLKKTRELILRYTSGELNNRMKKYK